MRQPKQPIEYSYQVTENIFAGEYPFKKTDDEGLPKLQRLLDFGIKHFIDLTEPHDGLTSYREYLPENIEYTRFPTVDMTVPNLEVLHKIHEIVSKSDVKVYVHCKGGFDRTGVVVATYFIYAGLAVEYAKKQYLQVANKQRVRYPHLPLIETRWEVLDEYEQFLMQHDVEMKNARFKDKIFGGIFGLAVADAMGVPVEFQSRESLRRNPVTDMRGYGTHNQPPGTWSDDTSLTLCLLDSLAKKGFNARWKLDSNFPEPDYTDIMQRFLSWLDEGKYTAHGEVFDKGNTTQQALQRFRKGTKPLKCGGRLEKDNGNGSLMRILPIIFYLCTLIENMSRWASGGRAESVSRYYIHSVSSLTHAHLRSQIACGIYLMIAHFIVYSSEDKRNLKQAIDAGLKGAKGDKDNYGRYKVEEYAKELKHYKRLFKKDFAKLPEEEIKSSGYVVDTLEAALWCLLNTDNYKDCVLKAVNLGDDTDTVAAVAGGLAGMYYGVESIPKEWLNQLARRDYIEELCEDFHCSLSQWHGDE